MELKGSKTEKNLWEAFGGESQAAMKYGYYASQAKKDGYIQIQKFFEETAKNETAHAKIWFKKLKGGAIPDTETNLEDCIAGENFEHTDMYVRMEKEAREEGFDDIADLFKGVGEIEAHHEERYQILLDNIKTGRVFKRDDENTIWICQNCGHIYVGKEAPEVCPICNHPRAHFEILNESYK